MPTHRRMPTGANVTSTCAIQMAMNCLLLGRWLPRQSEEISAITGYLASTVSGRRQFEKALASFGRHPLGQTANIFQAKPESSTAAKSLLRFALVVMFAMDIGMVFQGFQVSDNFGRHP